MTLGDLILQPLPQIGSFEQLLSICAPSAPDACAEVRAYIDGVVDVERKGDATTSEKYFNTHGLFFAPYGNNEDRHGWRIIFGEGTKSPIDSVPTEFLYTLIYDNPAHFPSIEAAYYDLLARLLGLRQAQIITGLAKEGGEG